MRAADEPRADARVLVGLMSGTSCDGIDAVCVELTGDVESGRRAVPDPLRARILSHHERPFEPAFRERLLAVAEAAAREVAAEDGGAVGADDPPGVAVGDARASTSRAAPAGPLALARLHAELGARFGDAASVAIRMAGKTPADVRAVCSPGWTACHRPPEPGDPGATLCLGDADVVAARSGCRVVSDLRAGDRAVGGHGAPLVPFADAALLRTPGRTRAALNLGGIANVTVVPPVDGEPVAFDTGPANMLLDAAIHAATNGERAFDEGGRLARAGRVDVAWLERALAEDDFLHRPPPRSTGRERYGRAFLARHAGALDALGLEDRLASLAAYTVEAVARSLERFVRWRPDELVVSGGGARNVALMQGLASRLDGVTVRHSQDVLGHPAETREAIAFAVLADATLSGVPCNVPGVTGARRAVCLGRVSERVVLGDASSKGARVDAFHRTTRTPAGE